MQYKICTTSTAIKLYFCKGTIANAMLRHSVLRELTLRSFREMDIDPRMGHSLSRVYVLENSFSFSFTVLENTLFISSTLNYFRNDSLIFMELFPACDFIRSPLVASNSTSDVCTNFSIGSTKSGLRWRTLKPFQRRMSSWGQQNTEPCLFISTLITHVTV